MTLDQWLIFVSVWTLAGLALGPNALNCIALSAGFGFRKSLWAVPGIMIASLCHMTAVILGVAAILLANAQLFALVKLCGAAYLIWMGFVMWRSHSGPPAGRQTVFISNADVVRRAFLISMSNPKAILAYLAVFSQFITPHEPLAHSLVILVPTALAITAIIFAGYCAVGSGVGRFLSTLRRHRLFNRTIATGYMSAGAALAADGLSGAGNRN